MSLWKGLLPTHYIPQFCLSPWIILLGQQDEKEDCVSLHGINALLSPSSRLHTRTFGFWHMMEEGAPNTATDCAIPSFVSIRHTTLNLQSSSMSQKTKRLKKTEGENWQQHKGIPQLISCSESPNRSKRSLRSQSCQESSINKSKLLHRATMQVPAEAFTFSGTLSFRS